MLILVVILNFCRGISRVQGPLIIYALYYSRDLEEKVGVASLSASCQSELEQTRGRVTTLLEGERRLKEELGIKLEMEKRLREELNRAKRDGDKWKQQLDKVKIQQGRQESEVVQLLEERVQKLEHQLRESQQTSSGGAPQNTNNEAIGRFEEEAERLIRTPVGVTNSGHGYVALEPVHPHHHRAAANREGEGEGGDSEQWSQLLESVLGKHFDQLDSSLQKMLSPN